jgi:hypothetical protein
MKIVSEAGEQISTDHAAKFTSGGDKSETTAAKKLNEQAGALKMLWKGLTMLMEYLKVCYFFFTFNCSFRLLRRTSSQPIRT